MSHPKSAAHSSDQSFCGLFKQTIRWMNSSSTLGDHIASQRAKSAASPVSCCCLCKRMRMPFKQIRVHPGNSGPECRLHVRHSVQPGGSALHARSWLYKQRRHIISTMSAQAQTRRYYTDGPTAVKAWGGGIFPSTPYAAPIAAATVPK